MKHVLAAACLALCAGALVAQEVAQQEKANTGNSWNHKMPTYQVLQAREEERNSGGLARRQSNPTYQGGPVLISAKVVLIFWGPSFSNAASPDYLYAQTLQAFRNQYGTTGEYNVITQYYQLSGGTKQFIQESNLGAGTADMFDSSTPPTNVTDALVQSEVNKYLSSHTFDNSTIYEVVIPSSSYSSDGSSDSCGGPNLQYCAYHGSYSSGSNSVKYAIEPYPSCGGCQVGGWTAAQNEEHFITHETREAATDPLGNGWWNTRTGYELDDECAWSPTPFLSGGYGYQYEWSNASSACVQTR